MLGRLTTKRQGKGSIPAALFGVLLCLSSVVLLWTNEGRPDLSKTGRKAAIVTADSSGTDVQGQLVSITGWVEVEEAATDSEYSVGGDYLRLNRHVEMYAWVEEHDSDDDSYDYKTEWTSSPANSDQFEHPEYYNPPLPVANREFYANRAWVGNFSFDPPQARLPSADPVDLGSGLHLPLGAVVSGNYIYIGRGATTQPEVGDVRINYTAVPAGRNVTLFGQLNGQQVGTFVDGKAKLYGIWEGSHDAALDTMHRDYVFTGWVMRIGGFFMLWFGMLMILSPLTNLLGYVPILGQVGRGVAAAITFVVALVISLTIIIVSFIAHRWYLLLLVLLVIVGVAVFLANRQRQRQAAGSA